MPQMRGIDLLHRLKNVRSTVKTVLCSGFSGGAENALFASGAVDLFLKKPTDANAVAASLRTLLDQAGRQKEPAE